VKLAIASARNWGIAVIEGGILTILMAVGLVLAWLFSFLTAIFY